MKESSLADKGLLVSFLALLLFGILIQFSANYPDSLLYFKRHIIYIGISIPFFIIASTINPKFLFRYSPMLHGISIILLLLVLFSPGKVNRWIYLSSFQFQPSEIAKFTLILLIPRILSGRISLHGKRDITVAIITAGITSLLILIEPDFGTAVIIFLIFLGILNGCGLPPSTYFLLISPLLSVIFSFHIVAFSLYFFLIIAVLLISKRRFVHSFLILLLNIIFGLITPSLWGMLKPYQKARLVAFLNPYKDPTGTGWHIIQSKVSIGSGGLLGKGFLHGQLKALKFIPMKNTDFVFSVVGEELGFVGSVLLIGLYTFFLLRILDIATKSKGNYTRLVSLGIFFFFFLHFTVNIGMCLGLLPVVGLPLPFFSYGGTHLIVSISLIGLLLNMKKNQYEYI